MKLSLLTFALSTLIFSSVLKATEWNNLTCTGMAENGVVEIVKLEMNKKKISLKYKISTSEEVFSQDYKTVEWMLENGLTEINEVAYKIGGSVSGRKNDYNDISLPNFGKYDGGLASEIAFQIGNDRVDGIVSCKNK